MFFFLDVPFIGVSLHWPRAVPQKPRKSKNPDFHQKLQDQLYWNPWFHRRSPWDLGDHIYELFKQKDSQNRRCSKSCFFLDHPHWVVRTKTTSAHNTSKVTVLKLIFGGLDEVRAFTVRVNLPEVNRFRRDCVELQCRVPGGQLRRLVCPAPLVLCQAV